MDKIVFGSDDGSISKCERIIENDYDNKRSEDSGWNKPTEHPEGPVFDPDINRMNQEFRNKIRSNHQEQWD